MNEFSHLEELLNQPNVSPELKAEVTTLLQKIHRLQKKNDILAQQNLELTQEMENIRGDFGNMR